MKRKQKYLLNKNYATAEAHGNKNIFPGQLLANSTKKFLPGGRIRMDPLQRIQLWCQFQQVKQMVCRVKLFILASESVWCHTSNALHMSKWKVSPISANRSKMKQTACGLCLDVSLVHEQNNQTAHSYCINMISTMKVRYRSFLIKPNQTVCCRSV